jgi:hypothetical protein
MSLTMAVILGISLLAAPLTSILLLYRSGHQSLHDFAEGTLLAAVGLPLAYALCVFALGRSRNGLARAVPTLTWSSITSW